MTTKAKFRVAVVGGGPAGLMAAEVMSAAGAEVVVFERMPTVGRKLLMAGRGGLNLTHSEDLPRFLDRYGDAREKLAPAIDTAGPDSIRSWCEGLGQETFVGTSGRVFPKAMKASPLLRAWLRRLSLQGVDIRTRHEWKGWDDSGQLKFTTPDGDKSATVDATVLALGGASWPRLGSNAAWVDLLAGQGIAITPLVPANCGVAVDWSETLKGFAGQPLKRIALTLGTRTTRGEVVVTTRGLEGGAIYALVPEIRTALAASGAVTIAIDLRPDLSVHDIDRMLDRPRGKQSMSSFLRKSLKLTPVAIALLNEAAVADGARLSTYAVRDLAALVKAVPVTIRSLAPMETAISSAGGVAFSEVDEHFMLKKKAGVFIAGEMLDWEAPTGGYLLQACLATGAAAGRGALHWFSLFLDKNRPTV